jgi:hypothetical protein
VDERLIGKEKKMKRSLIISILVVIVLTCGATDIFAKSSRFQKHENYVTFSFFIQPYSFGYKHAIYRNVFLTGNLDYESSDADLLFQAGAVYMIPRKVLFFRLYGGGGLELSRNRGVMYPYVVVGTNFLFLFAEIYHPLEKERTPGYRFGFSFSF